MRILLFFVFLAVAQAGQLAGRFGQEWSYSSQYPTRYTYGDTWNTSQGLSILWVSCNDCDGPNNVWAPGSNIGWMSESTDLKTLTAVNNLSNFGALKTFSIGACGSTESWKSSGHIVYSGVIYFFLDCQGGAASNLKSWIITSSDGGVTWCRSQDGACDVNGSVPTTTDMWVGASSTAAFMHHASPISYCPDNVGCAATADSNATYINGVTYAGDYINYYAWRVLKSDFAARDITKYTYWTGGSTWSSTMASATPMQVIIPVSFGSATGATVNMTSLIVGFSPGVTYITDAAISGGGVYIMTTSFHGQTLALWSDASSGPWTLFATKPITDSTVVSMQFPSPVPGSYKQLTASPYSGMLKIQMSGSFTAANATPTINTYNLYAVDLLIANGPQAPSRTLYSSLANRFNRPARGLLALWDFDTQSNGLTVRDKFGPYSFAMGQLLTAAGLQNNNSNSRYALQNGDFKISPGVASTGFNLSLSDITSGFMGTWQNVTTSSGANKAMYGHNASSSNAGFGWNVSQGSLSMRFVTRAQSVVTAAAMTSGATFAMVGRRKSGVLNLYRCSTTIGGPIITYTGATDNNATTADTIYVEGTEDDPGVGAAWGGSIAELSIYNVALNLTEIGQLCTAMQTSANQRGITLTF